MPRVTPQQLHPFSAALTEISHQPRGLHLGKTAEQIDRIQLTFATATASARNRSLSCLIAISKDFQLAASQPNLSDKAKLSAPSQLQLWVTFRNQLLGCQRPLSAETRAETCWWNARTQRIQACDH